MLQYSRVEGFPECRTSCTIFSFVNAFGLSKISAHITPSTKEQSASACSEPYKIMDVVQNPKSVSKAFLNFREAVYQVSLTLRSCWLGVYGAVPSAQLPYVYTEPVDALI